MTTGAPAADAEGRGGGSPPEEPRGFVGRGGWHLVAFLAALALILAMSLDWYTTEQGEEFRRVEDAAGQSRQVDPNLDEDAAHAAEGQEATAWQADAFIDRLILVACLLAFAAAVAAAFMRSAGRRPEPPWNPSAIATVAGLVGTLLILYRMFQPPGLNEVAILKPGAPLGLVAVGVLTIGARLATVAEQEERAEARGERPAAEAEAEPEAKESRRARRRARGEGRGRRGARRGRRRARAADAAAPGPAAEAPGPEQGLADSIEFDFPAPSPAGPAAPPPAPAPEPAAAADPLDDRPAPPPLWQPTHDEAPPAAELVEEAPPVVEDHFGTPLVEEPLDTPPVEDPVHDPPVHDPPVDDPPVHEPPVEEPPVEASAPPPPDEELSFDYEPPGTDPAGSEPDAWDALPPDPDTAEPEQPPDDPDWPRDPL